MRIGSFQTTFIPAPHSFPDFFPGNNIHPLHPPARAAQYREGGTSSIWIETSSQNLLVVGSAGFIPGGLCDVRAGSVFLSVASIARKGPVWIEKYFAECVLTVQAKQVFPIHWDDFTRPAREPLPPIPTWIDPVRRSMDQIEALCDRHQIQFSLLTYQQPLILTP